MQVLHVQYMSSANINSNDAANFIPVKPKSALIHIVLVPKQCLPSLLSSNRPSLTLQQVSLVGFSCTFRIYISL